MYVKGVGPLTLRHLIPRSFILQHFHPDALPPLFVNQGHVTLVTEILHTRFQLFLINGKHHENSFVQLTNLRMCGTGHKHKSTCNGVSVRSSLRKRIRCRLTSSVSVQRQDNSVYMLEARQWMIYWCF